MTSTPAPSHTPDEEAIAAFLSFSKGHRNFSARGWLMPLGNNEWMFILSDGMPDNDLVIHTMAERARFANWVNDHFNLVATEAPLV